MERIKLVIDGQLKEMMENEGEYPFYIIKFREDGYILGLRGSQSGFETSTILADEEGHYMIITKEGEIWEDNAIVNETFVHSPTYRPLQSREYKVLK